jgi:hypothetical protein
MDDEGQPMTTSRLYLELTARLIEREMAKFTSGEQAAYESFTNVAKLVGNAREELAAPWRTKACSLPTCVDAALD